MTASFSEHESDLEDLPDPSFWTTAGSLPATRAWGQDDVSSQANSLKPWIGNVIKAVGKLRRSGRTDSQVALASALRTEGVPNSAIVIMIDTIHRTRVCDCTIHPAYADTSDGWWVFGL